MTRMHLLKLVIAIVLVAIVAAAFFSHGSIGYTQNKNEANFCKNCHQMLPNIKTWELSAHSKVGCIKCHNDIDILSFVYKHWIGWYETPIRAKNEISSQNCLGCHNLDRLVTPSTNLIIPHDLHILKDIDCIACHSNITHFSISGKLKEFDLADGMLMQHKDIIDLRAQGASVSMDTCIRCHNGAKASGECTACHIASH